MLDPKLAVIVEPSIERIRVRLRLLENIAIPHRGGLDRVVRRGVEQECVAAGAFQPAPRALGGVVWIERPGNQNGGKRAWLEHARDPSHELFGY